MKDPPTAIVFQTEAANGILSGLKEFNLIPGKDVAMIGYNDLEIAKISCPPLSVFRLFVKDSGMRLLEILMEVIKRANPEDY